MPAPPPPFNEATVRHLLRRTEFVDRGHRVIELLATGSLEAAVDNVMASTAQGTAVFNAPENSDWQRAEEYNHFWLDRMAHDTTRPFAERMGFFWHTHFCSELSKVNWAEGMRQQLDLFRTSALGNLRQLAKDMSIQVAMLRYLDNNANMASSPNQNFARELMELFLLGVGNYTEADVEAATAAWTGHSDQWDDRTSPYRWRASWHDSRPKQFLGVTINTSSNQLIHGFDTIDVITGDGTIPAGAENSSNRGRRSGDVAAEFLSRKLWNGFATDGPVPADVLVAMRGALVGSGYEIRPWVRAMLTHPDFYTDNVRNGLVRSPVEYVVALLAATGRRSTDAWVLWLTGSMGQMPMFPPNVSGWRPNGYWLNASAAAARARAAETIAWRSMLDYWEPGGMVRLKNGTITNATIVARHPDGRPFMSGGELVDRIATLCDISLHPTTRDRAVTYVDSMNVWDRIRIVQFILMTPDMSVS